MLITSIDVRTGARLHPRGSDDEKKCSERDKTAGERLQNQRPHPLVRIGGEEDAHEIDTSTGCSSGCDLRAGWATAAAKKNEELDKDAEILRLIEERRSMPKEEKQRLKDLSKNSKKCIRDKKKNEETARH